MHAKQGRNKKRNRYVMVISIITLVLISAGAIYFYYRTPAVNRDVVTAQMPQETIKGLAVHFGSSGDALTQTVTKEELADEAQRIAATAKSLGMNTLYLYVQQEETILYRDSYLPLFQQLKENDSFFNPVDGLSAFCAAAQEHQLAVCTVIQADTLDDAGIKSVNRMFEKYPIAGVYSYQPQENKYTAICGEIPDIDGISQEMWETPALLFTQIVETEQKIQGVVFELKRINQSGDQFSILLSSLNEGAEPELLNYIPSKELVVTYPASDTTITTNNCFVMGTSDPAQELLLNGEPVERFGTGGVFGVLVSLEEDTTTLTFTQGAQTATRILTKPGISQPGTGSNSGTGSSSGSSNTQVAHDATVEVPEGTYVQVSGWISSLLYDPSDDGNINETVRRGAVAKVVDCVQTYRNGKQTWAYQLTGGDYILAYNTNVLGKEVSRANLIGIGAATIESGEVLTFSGEGTPLAYTNLVDNTLVLHFYDTDIAADFAVQNSSMVKNVSVQPLPESDGVELVLSFDAPLWGYTLEYTQAGMQLFLKQTPTCGQDPANPLAGVTVLLDPGHGDHDPGAPGAAGAGAPAEKDVNLEVAKAARYRLEQMGATVHMIRTDDTFLTLEERNAKITELQPDFFISVHHNSLDLSADANTFTGTECYYFYNQGNALASTLVDEVCAATNRTSRGAMWGYYYVTRNTTCPAVLLEVGFMVNPAEYEEVTNDTVIWKTGDAIARSILTSVPAG